MRMIRVFGILQRVAPIALGFAAMPVAHAAAPSVMTHQGRVTIEGVNFDGTGHFKFALVDGAGTSSYWSNDGTSSLAGEPTGAVPITVAKGYYSVGLGDGDANPAFTSPIPATAFRDHEDIRLRIWFSPTAPGPFVLLSPDRQLTSTGYAFHASHADTAGSADTSVSAQQATQADEARTAANGGHVFIRWGNDTAPFGATLIYSGFGYGSNLSSTGSMAPVVLQNSFSTSLTGAASGSLLYPLITGPTGGAVPTAEGIPFARHIKAAVCYSATPTTIIWGSHTAPSGWRVLYTGYAMGPFVSHNGPGNTIVVDSASFDGDSPFTGNLALTSPLYGTMVAAPAPSAGNTFRYLKAAVIQKSLPTP